MIDCGHPGVPPNAVLSGDKYTFGSTVHYTCTGRRSLLGQSSRTCQLNGQWSGSLPHCSGNIFGLMSVPRTCFELIWVWAIFYDWFYQKTILKLANNV